MQAASQSDRIRTSPIEDAAFRAVRPCLFAAIQDSGRIPYFDVLFRWAIYYVLLQILHPEIYIGF